MRHALHIKLIAVLFLVPTIAQAQSVEDLALLKRLGEEFRRAQLSDKTYQINTALAAFQKPNLTATEMRSHARTLLAHDEGTIRRVVAIVSKRFRSQRGDYLDSFHRAAYKLLKTRRSKNAEGEIARLRATILGMQDGGLTKDEIVRVGDPALARLRELLTVDRDAVFRSDETLRTLKGALLESLAIGHRGWTKLSTESRSDFDRLPPTSEFEKDLLRMEKLASYIATPMDRSSREIMESNFKIAPKIDVGEAEGILLLNIMRVQLGLNALATDLKLIDASRGHSKDMRTRGFFSHTSPVSGKRTPWDRAKLAGTSASAENIFMGINNAERAITGWWHSPGHHVNQLGKHRRVGLGRDGKYWTQMFGR